MRPWVIMAQNYSHLLWEVTHNCVNGTQTEKQTCRNGVESRLSSRIKPPEFNTCKLYSFYRNISNMQFSRISKNNILQLFRHLRNELLQLFRHS